MEQKLMVFLGEGMKVKHLVREKEEALDYVLRKHVQQIQVIEILLEGKKKFHGFGCPEVRE